MQGEEIIQARSAEHGETLPLHISKKIDRYMALWQAEQRCLAARSGHRKSQFSVAQPAGKIRGCLPRIATFVALISWRRLCIRTRRIPY